ncbi:MAG: hypothetical protein JXR53_09625 [Bacteroidales bacterium]|nr:hypothetical protein [Bacteroidales bacterium]
MKNKSILLWIFIIISVISTSALVTLVLVKTNFSHDHRPFHHEMNNQDSCHQKDALISSLNLDEEQLKLFNEEKTNHIVLVGPIFDSIMQIRSLMIDELKLENPDTVKIQSYVEGISVLEKELQMESVHHMLNMKKFLNPVQIDSLFSFFGRRMMPGHPNHHRKSEGNHQRHCK